MNVYGVPIIQLLLNWNAISAFGESKAFYQKTAEVNQDKGYRSKITGMHNKPFNIANKVECAPNEIASHNRTEQIYPYDLYKGIKKGKEF